MKLLRNSIKGNEAAKLLGITPQKLRTLATEEQIGRPNGPTLWFAPNDLAALEKALAKLCWLAIVSPENWSRLLAEGLSFTLFPGSREASTQMMREGNRIAFYVSRRSVVAGIAEITGKRLKRTVVWENGVFTHYVPLKAIHALDASAAVPFKSLVDRLGFVRQKEQWEGYVRGSLRQIAPADFGILEAAVRGMPNILGARSRGV